MKRKKSVFKKAVSILMVSFFILGVISFSNVKTVDAASLYLSPNSGTNTVGSSFSVSVYTDSSEEAMNATSGTVSFSVDKLEVVSVSKDGTIISFWAQEPTFSNLAGTVSYEGVILSAGGYTGSAGKIVTINFKVKSTGSSVVSFSSGSVLANDGKGTNILVGMGSGNYDTPAKIESEVTEEPVVELIVKEEVSVVVEEVEEIAIVGEEAVREIDLSASAYDEPVILSKTHPDQDIWYSENDVMFNWELPYGATGVSVMMTEKANSNPGPNSDGLFSSKEFKDIEDGIWYLHLKIRKNGEWSQIAHYRIMIDSAKPEYLKIREVERASETLSVVAFGIESSDELSGLDYYTMQVDNDDSSLWYYQDISDYKTDTLLPGEHKLLVKAFDKAGNYISDIFKFVVNPVKSPMLVCYPAEVKKGESLMLRGVALPNSNVVIWLQKRDGIVPLQVSSVLGDTVDREVVLTDNVKKYIVKSDQAGNFTLIVEGDIRTGIYDIWAQAVDEYGASSLSSPNVIISVSNNLLGMSSTYLGILVLMSLSLLFNILFAVIMMKKASVIRNKKKIIVRSKTKVSVKAKPRKRKVSKVKKEIKK